MSSFSSVIRKPGSQIKPKAAPRRNIQRKAAEAPLSTPDSQTDPNLTSNGGNREDAATSVVQETLLPTGSPIPPSSEEIPKDHTHASENYLSVVGVADTHGAEVEFGNNTQPAELILEKNVPAALSGIADGAPRSRILRGAKRKHIQEDEVEVENTSIQEQEHNIVSGDETENLGAESIGVPVRTEATANSTSLRKKRRTTAISISIPEPSHAETMLSPVNHDATGTSAPGSSQSSTDLLQSATIGASSVSELANSVDAQANSQHPRTATRISNEDHSAAENDGEEAQSETRAVPARRKRTKKTAQEQAAEVVASAMEGSGSNCKTRDLTPEDAENYQLDPDEMIMGKLCKDSKLGKKSNLETEMQANWPEILQRRKEDRDRALAAAQSRRRNAFGKVPTQPVEESVALQPQVTLVNGKIVVLAESREIDRSAQLTQAAVLDATNVREDKIIYKRVNQATVGMKANYGKKFRWDEQATELFYKGLRMFGTDFLMIANMFPGVDRKQIKKKFIREENADKKRVMDSLQNREEIDLEEYSQVTDIQLQDVKTVEEAIQAEEQRLRDEDNERRKREGFTTTATGAALPSIEGADGAGTNNATQGVDGAARYAELAANIMAPRKKDRRTTTAAAKKRGARVGRQPNEGIEEILGSIDEVRV